MSDERCSVDDLWALIAWAEMHAELQPFADEYQPGINRGITFVHAEIKRRNRRSALNALGGKAYRDMRPRGN